MKNRFSVASYSFHGLYAVGAMNIFHYFETVRYRYHLSTADIWNGMLERYDEEYLRLIKQQMDEHELALVNLCCDGAHVWNDDQKEKELCDRRAEECLRAAEILGAETVRIDLGIAGDDATDEQIEYCAKVYDSYCQRVAQFGAKLGPENHWGASTNVSVMRKLFEAVKAENFSLLLHLGNWHKTPDITFEKGCEYDLEFAPRAMHMHMHYEACLNGENQFPALAKAGYSGCWGIESHKSVNEYNNVAFQLAQAKRVLVPLTYKAKPKGEPSPEVATLIEKLSK